MSKDDRREEKQEVKKEEKIEVKDEIKEIEKEVEIWKNKYLRALADYQNLDRRNQEEAARFRREANKRLLTQFLEVLDDLEKAALFVSDDGLKLIKDKFVKILYRAGVRELEVLGKPFDPETAECIEVVPGADDNTVVEVTRKGYTLYDEVLRVAQIKVGKKTD